MSKDEVLQKIKRRWSRDDASFYKELEAFFEKHKDAGSITYDSESGCPMYATYGFTPYQCFKEHEILMLKIAIANEESKEQLK